MLVYKKILIFIKYNTHAMYYILFKYYIQYIKFMYILNTNIFLTIYIKIKYFKLNIFR